MDKSATEIIAEMVANDNVTAEQGIFYFILFLGRCDEGG